MDKIQVVGKHLNLGVIKGTRREALLGRDKIDWYMYWGYPDHSLGVRPISPSPQELRGTSRGPSWAEYRIQIRWDWGSASRSGYFSGKVHILDLECNALLKGHAINFAKNAQKEPLQKKKLVINRTATFSHFAPADILMNPCFFPEDVMIVNAKIIFADSFLSFPIL